MNLADFLCYADIGQLGRIAKSCGCDCDGHSKNELIQAILNTVLRRDWLDRLAESLDLADLRFINSLLFENRDGYSLEELTARAMQARYDEPDENRPDSRELIVQFRHRGWLFNGHSPKTKFLMQVPSDLKAALTASIGRRFSRTLRETGEPDAYRDEHSLLQDDLLTFLRFVRDNDVPLTTDGVIYKRMLDKILEGFSVKEEPLGRVGFRFGYGRKFRNYPDRFSLLYDYCHYGGLLAEGDGELTLTASGLARANEGKREDLWQMVRLWLRLYKGPIPNIVAMAYWTLYLCGNWVTLKSLSACLSPLVKPFYYDSPETVLEKRIVRMLMHLGLLQLGEHGTHGTVVRAHAGASSILKKLSATDDEPIRLKESEGARVRA